MVKEFSESEKYIRKIITDSEFIFEGEKYVADLVAKPIVEGGGGETKTDAYIVARNTESQKTREIKITFKKPNFSFVENKIKAERAAKIYGKNWSNITQGQIKEIKNEFQKKPLFYFEKTGRVERGSITLGWRYEMEDEGSRKLGVKIKQNIAEQVWANKNASSKYRDGVVDKKIVPMSGVPNYYLNKNPSELLTVDDIFPNLKPMSELFKTHSNITAAFLAQNFRSHKNKQEGNKRHLAVWVVFKVENGKLDCELVFDRPLQMESGHALKNLEECLNNLGIKTWEGFTIDVLSDKLCKSCRSFP
mgnify:CR=1 FL=1